MAKYNINAKGSLLLLNLFSFIVSFSASFSTFVCRVYSNHRTMVLHKSLMYLNFSIYTFRKDFKYLFLAILFFSFQKLKSQDLCQQTSYTKGDFDLSSLTLCLPQILTVTNTSTAISVKYIFDYQGEDIDEARFLATNQASFDYSSRVKRPETITVLQIGDINGKTSIACKNLTVRPSNVPVYSYTTCTNNNLVVNLPQNPLNDFDEYEISINNSLTTITQSQLPFEAIKNTTLPAQLRVQGKYLDPAKGCQTPAAVENVSSYLASLGGIDRPYHPNISKLRLDTPTKASFTFTGAYHASNQTTDQYKLYVYPSGSLPNPSSVTMVNILPGKYTSIISDSTKSYCFFVKRETNVCGLVPEQSAEICTIPLKKAAFVPYRYDLEWVKYPSLLFGLGSSGLSNLSINQQITRIENSSNLHTILLSPNAFTHSDYTINCKKKYCYRLKVNTTGQFDFFKFTGQSISNMICVDRSAIIPNSTSEVYVSTNPNNQNAVFFNKQPTWPIEIDRWILYKNDGRAYTKFDSLSHPTDFVSDTSLVSKSESYKISYVDKCESQSILSDSVASTFLSFKEPNQLAWNIELPFDKSGIGLYEVLYFNENSNTIKLTKQESNNQHEISFKEYDLKAKFRLKTISDNSPLSFSYSNTIIVDVPGSLNLPNIFTPNGDLINDILSVKGDSDNLLTFSLEIFNRFGEKIAQISNPKESWDGTIKGKVASAGIYLYRLSAILKNGETLTKDGIIELMR